MFTRKIFVVAILFLLCYHAGWSQQDTTAKQLDEVVVTGQFTPQPLRNSVYKVRVISAARIRMRAATDLTGVLNSELGIRISTDNTLGESDTRILGLGGSRVKILLDGIPLADRDATKQSLTQIDINSVERVEIIEGPMSVTYGTDALAGVINIITKKAVNGTHSLSVTARVQEESIGKTYSPFRNEGIHNEHIGLSWNNAHWKASAYLTRNNFGGFTDTASFPAKVFKPKEQWMTGGTFGYRNTRFNAWYRLDYLNEDLLAASAMNVNNYISTQQHYLTHRYTHQAQADWQLNNHVKLNASASYQNYSRNTESFKKNYQDGSNAEDHSSPGLWDLTEFKTWFFRSTAAWIISSKLSLQPGVDIKYDHTSGERVSGNPSITDYSFFISSEIKPAKGINIRPGLRFSKNSVYAAPPVIPSINTKFTLNQHSDLRLSYARGFRAPILRELYFNFFDANHSIQGNPDLKAEHSNSYMASLNSDLLSFEKVKINSSLSGFYNNYSNFIDLYSFTGAGGGDIFSYFNRDKYKTLGFTFDNTVTVGGLTAMLGLSYIGYYNRYQEDASLKGDRSNFAWSPEVNVNLAYHIKPIKTDLGLYYKFTGKVPTYTMNAGNDIVLSERDAFHWADLSVSRKIFHLLTLQAGIKNIFNVTRLNNSGTNTGGAHSDGAVTNYAYGRSWFAGIQFNWNK